MELCGVVGHDIDVSVVAVATLYGDDGNDGVSTIIYIRAGDTCCARVLYSSSISFILKKRHWVSLNVFLGKHVILGLYSIALLTVSVTATGSEGLPGLYKRLKDVEA